MRKGTEGAGVEKDGGWNEIKKGRAVRRRRDLHATSCWTVAHAPSHSLPLADARRRLLRPYASLLQACLSSIFCSRCQALLPNAQPLATLQCFPVIPPVGGCLKCLAELQ